LPSGTVPAFKPVFLMGAAANRDPRAFDDAETFDITRDRTQAQNLGLGYGIHSCLGAALARMESAIALEHLLDFMPHYEVDFGLCESNGVCMGIIPEVFDLDDEDYLHVLQDEVTPENEQGVRESVRQCPRQAIFLKEV
jgi:ferredoxin